MKKILLLLLTLMFLFPISISANMAAPNTSDIATSITFKENNDISVLSEILNIEVEGSIAHIEVIYNMKNMTNKNVVTESMFISPNILGNKTKIYANNQDLFFKTKTYNLNYATSVGYDDWHYVILNEQNNDTYEELRVDTVLFDLSFKPNEEYDVIVSYDYRLGGYPDYDFDAKDGIITYYLKPCMMWNDFNSLTINLYLDKDMPVISESNLEFTKIKSRTYQYVSDKLPDEDLYIVIDENWFQNIFSTLRSPYFWMAMSFILPIVIILVLAIIIIMWFRKKFKNKK